MTTLESYRSTRVTAALLSSIAAAAMLWAFYLIFFYAPTERQMGVVQRIYYVHVPSAWVAFLAFGIVALCSVGYLWLRDPRLDGIALGAAEIGLVFTSGVLITGPLWGRLAWGDWWVWEDARLTLTLLLWLIYVAYFMIRNATDNPEKGKRFAAVVGVVGAVDIPLIHMSVQWFRSQHPQAVVLRPEGPTADPEIVVTLLVSLLAFTLTFFALLLDRQTDSPFQTGSGDRARRTLTQRPPHVLLQLGRPLPLRAQRWGRAFSFFWCSGF
jgi:heme exporter protein C